jgi:hypothetical protein
MSPEAPFLMRWHFSHVLGGGRSVTIEDTCIVVYSSGRFRMEKSTHSKGETSGLRAFEDSLNENDLQQLQELLDDPMLKGSAHQRFAISPMREGEVTALAVSREGRTQQLSFASYFRRYDKYIGAGIDPDERLVTPLRKWLQHHIEARKLEALPNASATSCIAPQAERP